MIKGLAQGWLNAVSIRPSNLRRALIKARRAEPLEYEQLMIRYILGIFITAGAVIATQIETFSITRIFWLKIYFLAAWILGFGFFCHFVFWPTQRVARRTVTILYDAAALSAFIYLTGETASIFFPVYLWVILGNGFRYGIRYMYASMIANNVLFAITAWLTPHWREEWQFSLAAQIALIAIPLYASTLIRELREAMAQAEAANKAKSDFLAIMSHELRTPLNAIMGLAQVLDRTAASPEDRMSAMSIHSAAGRLLEMVDSILNFQKIQHRGVEVHEQSFDLKQLLLEIRSIVHPLALRKNLHMHVRFASALPDQVSSDKDHLKTVMINLLTNAVKYTKQGDIWIIASVLPAEGATHKLRVEVRDTGIGIDPAYRGRLFEKFVQTEATERSAEGGVGLGLSMCKSLISLLGETIDFVSKVGEGSTFWFEVPVGIGNADQAITNDTMCKRIAFLTSRPAYESFTRGMAADRHKCGMHVINARDFVKAQAASGDLWKYVLIVDERELDDRSISAIRHAAASAPIPPAIALLSDAREGSSSLANVATGFLAGLSLERARELVRTIAKWHGLALSQLTSEDNETSGPPPPAKILVADDNPFNREVAKKLLHFDGHHVTLATTGEEALEALLKGGFDIAFLDINMPGGNGIEICKQYRMAVEPSAQIPLIAMTADASQQMRTNCLKAGMDAVLHKPVQLEELRQNIRVYARRRTSQAGLAASPTPFAHSRSRAAKAPTLDRARMSELVSLFGAEAFRTEMLEVFKDDFQQTLAQFRDAIAAKDARAMRDARHALRSTANNIGAARIGELCREMRDNKHESPEKTFIAIRREYSKFLREADLLLAASETEARAGAAGASAEAGERQSAAVPARVQNKPARARTAGQRNRLPLRRVQ